jgi:hypothetical protein
MTWRILCESPDLAVQCLAAARELEHEIRSELASDPCRAALPLLAAGEAVAIVLLSTPELTALVELATAARGRAQPLVLALPVPSAANTTLIDAAAELGLYAVRELRPLLALLHLLEHGGQDAMAASSRALGPSDRARLKPVLSSAGARSGKTGGQLVPIDELRIGWAAHGDGPSHPLGEARDVSEALAALTRTEREQRQVQSSVDDVDPRAVLDIIFGPRRALSDPASKAALAPYGIPLPVEELCGSPSRAASEANRIGYPVRISLASPDLRVWDHPDLSVDMVDNAARVRDTFRQLMAAAEQRVAGEPRAGGGRILGVMVTATSEATALLGVRAHALPQGKVAMEIGFADPHGRSSNDRIVSVLPAEAAAIERSLRRLSGSELLLGAAPALRKARVDAIADVLLRLSAFVHDRRQEIEAVELRPLAVLLDGSVEVREACISVSDFFERTLMEPG